MKKLHYITFFLILTFVFVLSADLTADAAKKKLTSIEWEKYDDTLTIKKGEKQKLKVKYTPKKKVNKTLKWSTSNKKIVTVTKDGTIKGKKKGKATITAKTKDGSGLSIKLKVTVGTKVKSIKLASIKTNKLYVGKKCQLNASVAPSNSSNKKIKWESSDKTIATVSSKGLVKGVGNGKVTIIAKTADGTGLFVKQKFEVIVPVKSIDLKLSKATPYCQNFNSNGVYAMVGTTFTLSSTVSPETATNKTLKWISSNETVAKVSAKGVVTVNGQGIAKITAAATDGSGKSTYIVIYSNSYSRKDCTFVAHRGDSYNAPENSLSAFRLAFNEGFEYVEFDVWKTADDKFAVLHNESLKKMCGVDVNITSLTLDKAMKYKLTAGNGIEKYPNEYIPSLEQVLALSKTYPNAKFNIELKSELSDKLLSQLLEMIKQYKLEDRVRIISFKLNNIVGIRKLTELGGDAIPLAYLAGGVNDNIIKNCVDLNVQLSVDYKALDKKTVTHLHEQGIEVSAWTVPDFSTVGYLIDSMRVDSITSNCKFFTVEK